MNEKKKEDNKQEHDQFAFEVSFSDDSREIIEELDNFEETQNEPQKQSTIKIISERDIKYKVAPPPNFSKQFKCILHFRDSDYKNRKILK
ncbi:MAG: hypothetical protein EAX90_01735 [Candidatus Heimdallarchaeota archaeon]|nr:hypothetical protein [Candidatus Heimdallarchaeota archaeon]